MINLRTTIDNDNEVYINPKFEDINKWWIEATSRIYKEDRLIYCVKIDGQPLFNEYEKYIVKNFGQIREINIETKSKQESISETKIAIQQFLEKFIPAGNLIADSFYSGMDQQNWQDFSDFIEGLNWLLSSFEFINVLNPTQNISLMLSNFEQNVKELSGSLERQEYVLSGDLIKYEILPSLENYNYLTQ